VFQQPASQGIHIETLREEMIVENINQDTGNPPAVFSKASLTAQHCGVLVCVLVDLAMERDADAEFARFDTAYTTLEEIPQQVAQ